MIKRLVEFIRASSIPRSDRRVSANRRSARLEALEGRELLSITEFPFPTFSSSRSIALGADHALWFTEDAAGKIGRLDAMTGAVTEYTVPDPLNSTVTAHSSPNGILAGSDGNLYFMMEGSGAPGSRFANSDEFIDRLNPATGAITNLTLPSAITNMGLDLHDAAGPDGNLYFSTGGNLILQFNPSTGTMKTLKIPDANAGAAAMAVGSDGALYMTYSEGGAGTYYFARLDPSSGAFKRYLTPDKTNPTSSIIQGRDGNFYFLEYGDRLSTYLNKIDQFNPASHAFKQYTVNTSGGSSQTEFDFGDIINGPDGNIYFADPYGETIGEFNLSTQTITKTPMPASVHQPAGLAIGPDNNLWFTEAGIGASKIGQMTLSTQGGGTTGPTNTSPPTITGESVVIVKKKIVGFQLNFSASVNAGAIGDYAITETLKQKKKFVGKRVIIKAANYNSANHTVQLIFKGTHAFALGGQIVVNSSLITDASGRALDGSNNGDAGSPVSFTISKKAKSVSR